AHLIVERDLRGRGEAGRPAVVMTGGVRGVCRPARGGEREQAGQDRDEHREGKGDGAPPPGECWTHSLSFRDISTAPEMAPASSATVVAAPSGSSSSVWPISSGIPVVLESR